MQRHAGRLWSTILPDEPMIAGPQGLREVLPEKPGSQKGSCLDSPPAVSPARACYQREETYQMNHPRSFPCPGINRQITTCDNFLGVFESSFAFNGPIRYHFNEIPLSLLCEAFGKSSSSVGLPCIKLESLLKAFGCSNWIQGICGFRIIDPKGSKSGGKGGEVLERRDEVLKCLLPVASYESFRYMEG